MEYLPTIRQLQYLLALSEQGSFSKAAQYCHVTQSTLSAGIRELEKLLGHEVVDRSKRQLLLSPLGKSVLEDARAILTRAADITARARALGQPLSGPLHMGIIPTIAPYLLPTILPPLQRRFPSMALQLTEDRSARITAQLHGGDLDLILLAFPYETPGMVQTNLFTESFYIACPKGTWQGHNPAQMEDLREQKLLLLEEGHCLRDHALAACQFPARAGRETFNATSLPTLIQFVQHGYGITLLPEIAVHSGTVPDNVDIIPFADPRPARQIGLVWRQNHPQEKDFQLLAAAIKAAL